MRKLTLILSAAMIVSGPALADVSTIEWSSVPTNNVALFYPGQSSYQWLRGPEHRRAFRKTEEGDSCVSCHEGEELEMGEAIVEGGRLEPHPIEGKQPVIDLAVQATHDDENLYLKFQWETRNPYPGTAHPHWIFDGAEWKVMGWPRLHQNVWEDGQPAIYEDRLSMMVDDGSVPMFAEQGCWLSCHDGMRDMQDLALTADVQAHPILGELLHKKDVRKYLPGSRTDDEATWTNTMTAEQLVELQAAGGFVDLMQFRAHRSLPIGMADDGYVLEYRLTDDGQNIFSKNWDSELNQPKYMFDESVAGITSRTLDEIRDLSQPSSLVVGVNTVAFDPNVDWEEGDMIPEYFVRGEGGAGSAADNSNVQGMWEDGVWTVVWVRPLDTGNPADDKIMEVGGVYTFGFAVHDDNITTRGHHVSFPMTVGIGAEADIQAVTQ